MSFWKKWFHKRRPRPAHPASRPLWPPAELRFPGPPFPIDASLSDTASEARATYIARVQTWRHEVLRAVQPWHSCERFELSHWARSTLLHFLCHDWNAAQHARAGSLPYNLAPFPISAFDRDSEDAVLDLLRWRAAADDFFADVGDAPSPSPDVLDCERAGSFLSPVYAEPLCILCLTALAAGLPIDMHDCLVLPHLRARPRLPFGGQDR